MMEKVNITFWPQFPLRTQAFVFVLGVDETETNEIVNPFLYTWKFYSNITGRNKVHIVFFSDYCKLL
jgi:hypothetical protein